VDDPLREREYPLTGCDAYGALADDVPYEPSPAIASPPGEGGHDGGHLRAAVDASAPDTSVPSAAVESRPPDTPAPAEAGP
jgi:hypothetical protein